MTATTSEPRVWHAGDPEPEVGTTVLRADGRETTRHRLGWMPGPYNWLGILSLGEAVEVPPTRSAVAYQLPTGGDRRTTVQGRRVPAQTGGAR